MKKYIKKDTADFMITMFIIMVIVASCISVLPKRESNEVKPENLLETSTKEYKDMVCQIVKTAYEDNDKFQLKALYTTELPYMRFKISCKHETKEECEMEAEIVAKRVFYCLKLFEYESPFWKYTYELINLEFESEKRDKHTGVLDYAITYKFDVNELKDYETCEEYFEYKFK